MTQSNYRSVAELRRESERTRAGLADTVDQLRSTVNETAADVRERLSPDAIKAEVGDYFRTRGERLIDKARENPLQAAAIGAGLAYPLIGIVRSIPVPVLMIGAGLFLMGTKTGQSASRAVVDKASDLAEEIGDRADSLRHNIHDARDYASDQIAAARGALSSGVDNFRQGAAELVDQASTSANNVRDRAAALGNTLAGRTDELAYEGGAAVNAASGATRDAAGRMKGAASNLEDAAANAATRLQGAATGAASNLKDAASDAASRVQGAATGVASNLQDVAANAASSVRGAASAAASNVEGAVGAAADYSRQAATALRDNAAQTVARASSAVKDTMLQNPLLIGGIGLAVGAFIAACLPRSDLEQGLMGETSTALQKRVRDAASQGVEAAKSAVSSAYGEALERAQEEGLSPDGLKEAAQGLGRKIRSVADNAATTAYELADEKTH